MAKRIVIIGGGPAGIEAAKTAARLGGRVSLICDRLWGKKMGQSVLWSKMWMQGSDVGALTSEVKARLEGAETTWQKQLEKDLTDLGVEVLMGRGVFQSENVVGVLDDAGQVMDTRSADAVIVATGSEPIFPPGFEPDGERVFAPHMIDLLDEPPKDMIVIGDGGPGFVYVDALSRLGVKVTWLGGGKRVLGNWPASVGDVFARVFEQQGVTIALGQFAKCMERDDQGVAVVMPDETRHSASTALVAIGYRPSLGVLNLGAAGLVVSDRGRVAVDGFGRTGVSHVYVAGEATGFGSANTSMAQGRIAGCDVLGVDVPPFCMDHIVVGFETQPNVAAVGQFGMADVSVTRASYASGWKATECGEIEGFVEMAYDAQRRVIWGVVVGAQAGDVLAPVAVAIRTGATVDDLASVYGMHPSLSEVVFEAARQVSL